MLLALPEKQNNFPVGGGPLYQGQSVYNHCTLKSITSARERKGWGVGNRGVSSY